MTEAQFLISILTILGSGVVSAVVTYKLNRSKEVKELYRTKLEELFKATSRFTKMLFSIHFVWLNVMDEKITYNEGLDHIHIEEKEKDSYENCEMLINLYFPELKNNFQSLLESRDKLSRIHMAFKKDYERTGPTAKYNEEFKSELVKLTKKEEVLKAAIFEIASKRKRNRVRPLK